MARYKEDLDWLENFQSRNFHKVWIYNKSESPTTCKPVGKNCQIITLPNVGVCDHTYLHHIYTRYDELPDVTVFIPASGYLRHKHARISATIDRVFETQNSAIYGYIRPQGIRDAIYSFVIKRHVTYEKMNQDESGFHQDPSEIRPFGKWYEAHFPGVNSPMESSFGIFAASRAHIHLRPKEFYKKLLDQVDSAKYHEASHFIERSWPAIFHPFPKECFYDALTLPISKEDMAHYHKVADEHNKKYGVVA